MIHQQRHTVRGMDAASGRVFRASELQDVDLPEGGLVDLLAVLLFLGRHADRSARLVVEEVRR